MIKKCKKCGKALAENDKYCSNCGERTEIKNNVVEIVFKIIKWCIVTLVAIFIIKVIMHIKSIKLEIDEMKRKRIEEEKESNTLWGKIKKNSGIITSIIGLGIKIWLGIGGETASS